MDISNLVDGAAASETYLAKVKDLLDLLQGGLSTLCPRLTKPGEEAPKSLLGLAEFFRGDKILCAPSVVNSLVRARVSPLAN